MNKQKGLFMAEDIPKIKLSKLPAYVTDIFMRSFDFDEEVKQPKVRNMYRLFFISIIFLALISFILSTFIKGYLINDINLSYYYRLYNIFISIYLIIIALLMSTMHYKYIFSTGKDLSLMNVIIFYLLFVSFFGLLYFNIYTLYPLDYNMINPLWQPSIYLSNIGFKTIMLSKIDFIIYSSCSMFNITYPRISSNSVIVSILNILEVMVGISLISLFISTFVQKTCK